MNPPFYHADDFSNSDYKKAVVNLTNCPMNSGARPECQAQMGWAGSDRASIASSEGLGGDDPI